MTKTNLGLVEYAKSKLNLPTMYMLSGFGRALLHSEVDRRIQNGCRHTAANEKTIRAAAIQKRTDSAGKTIPNPHLTVPNAHYCFDCVGLIKGYLWEQQPGVVYFNIPSGSDQNVGGMYNSAKRKGPLSTMPDLPGMLVFTADMGHVGIYTGKVNGIRQYIEATPNWSAWGVTTSADRNHPQGRNRTWAYWGQYHLIDYVTPEPPKPEPVVPTPTPTPTYKVGDKVKWSGKIHADSYGGNPSSATYATQDGEISIVNKNPYPIHIKGMGWIKVDQIQGAATTTAPTTPTTTTAPTPVVPTVTPIKVGDKVKVTGMRYATGQLVPKWVKLKSYKVIKISDGKGLLDQIRSWVYLKDLEKQ